MLAALLRAGAPFQPATTALAITNRKAPNQSQSRVHNFALRDGG